MSGYVLFLGKHGSYSSYLLTPLLTAPLFRLSLVFMNLTVLRSTGQVFCRMSLFEICLIFFHDYTEAMSFEEEDHKSKVPFSSHYIKSTSINMTFAIDIDLDQVAEIVFDRLLHWKVLLYVSSLLPSSAGSHTAQSSLREEGLCSTTLGQSGYRNYFLHTLSVFCIGDLSLTVLQCWSLCPENCRNSCI